MSTVRTDLQGARWSSAVRCIARAEFQALGIEGDDDATAPLHEAFARGVAAADAWVTVQQKLNEKQGKTLLREVGVAWGPDGIWTGHADAVIEPDSIVMEAYHAVGGVFREEKALQVAQYARKLGPNYLAMLAALDTTDVDIDGGFAVSLYPVDVNGLADRCEDIEMRVSAAYEAGEVNFDDRVASDPFDKECSHCPFRGPCWAGYEPPMPEDVPELADLLDRLALAQSDHAHLKTATADANEHVQMLRDQIRPYVAAGHTIQAGGVQVKRQEIAARKSFKLGDYLKAGHPMSPTMADFASIAGKPGERWYVTRVDP